MKKYKYCNKELNNDFVKNKIGDFCSEEHFRQYLDSLSNKEYIKLQNTFSVCSDE